MKDEVLMAVWATVIAVALFGVVSPGHGGDTADEEAIRANAKAYAEAVSRGDVEAVGAFWAEDGVWSEPATGTKFTGRERILKEYADFLEENKGTKMEVEVTSVSFVTDDVAIEEGTTRVTLPGDGNRPTVSSYLAVHSKGAEGAWLTKQVTETVPREETAAAAGNASEPLKPLAWLIGEWVDSGEESMIHFQNSWAADGNFIKRDFTVFLGDEVDMEGMEIVGWDPKVEQVRSWVFDSKGGFGELKWQPGDEPDEWVKEAKAVLSDGTYATAVHIMKKIDEDGYSFEAVSRERDGELLPNIPPVVVVRHHQGQADESAGEDNGAEEDKK